MRPPSYYTSIANNNTGNSSYSTLPNSSKQLRSSFSSPTSATYASRTHLPFVAQSALVAHCITSGGSSSSLKPYGGYGGGGGRSTTTPTRSSYISSASSSLSSPSYSSSSSSSASSSSSLALRSGGNHYSNYGPTSSSSSSSSRPLSTSRPSSSAYLSTTTGHNYTSSASRSSSYTPLARPSYLSTSQSAASRSTYRPNLSSYYKPVRIRERPLLNQLQVRLTTGQSTTRSPTPNSARRDVDEDGRASADLTTTKSDGGVADEEEEKTWSSDVTRNISRNKYLIKFKEYDNNNKAARQSVTELAGLADNLHDLERKEEQDVKEGDSMMEEQPKMEEKLEATTRSDEVEKESKNDCERKQVIVLTDSLESSQQVDCDKIEGSGQKGLIETNDSFNLTNKNVDSKSSAADEPQKAPTKSKAAAAVKKRNVKLKLQPIKVAESEKGDSGAKIEQSMKGDTIAPISAQEAKSKVTTITCDPPPVVVVPPTDAAAVTTTTTTSTAALATAVEPKQKTAKVVRTKRPIKSSGASKPKLKLKVDDQQNEQQQQLQKQPAAETSNTERRKVLAPKQPKLQSSSIEESKQVRDCELAKEEERDKLKPQTKNEEQKEQQRKQQIESIASQSSNAIKTRPNNSKRIRFREYNFDDFNFLTVLGHGGWGFVVLAELKEHDACFAVKCIKKITIVEDDDFESILIERKVLTLGNVHPFICKLFCTFETEGYLFFVMEYCAGGDLMFHVQHEGKFSESRCRFYAAEIICAIRFLHNRHIIYRDLKLDNILLDSSGHIRLVDFGMCQCRTYREEMLPSNFCGTPEYISPEIIKGVPYNHSVDWWSFGVLLYEMAVGKMPFRGSDENELLWNVCYEQIHYPMFLSKELTSLLQSLLEREPNKRMGMATCKAGDIQDQPFFHSVDWRAVEELRIKPPFIPEVNSKCDVQNFDTDFTESTCELSPVDESTLNRIDQSQFQKFPYTNPNIEIFDSQP